MQKKIIAGIVFLLFAAVSGYARPVPDTGDPNERACNPHSYTDLGNGIVRDTVTGLEWQKTTAPGTYTWLEAVNHCNRLGLGGHDDWRLPTVKELSTLVDSSLVKPGPTIASAFFPDTRATKYWSSTPYVSNTARAWQVDFAGGSVLNNPKTGALAVRAVRGKPYGEPALVDNGDGTITDTRTGLVWQKERSSENSWSGAKDYCSALRLSGRNDWRLPNRNELQSIVDYQESEPSINDGFFTVDHRDHHAYWSSTSVAAARGTDLAWYVSFQHGNVSSSNKTYYCFVRAVRGGPCGESQPEPQPDPEPDTPTDPQPEPKPCAAAYLLGDDDPRLDTLRRFRDEKLFEGRAGRIIIEIYYERSGDIVELCEGSPAAKGTCRKMLEMVIPAVALLL